MLLPISLIIITYITFTASSSQLILHRVEMCDRNINYSNTFAVNLNSIGSAQYADIRLIHKVDLDEHIDANLTLKFRKENTNIVRRKTYKYICQALNRYLASFWHDIEKALGIYVGKCPIAKGQYQAQHFRVNSNRLPAGLVPYGDVKAKIEYFSNNNPQIMCFTIEFTYLNNLDKHL